MSISAITNSLPSLTIASPVQMFKNLKLIALPAIALGASVFMPTVEEV